MKYLIKASLPHLSPCEARVARVCLRYMSSLESLSSRDISKLAGVSPPTVVRFFRSIGFSGMSEFRGNIKYKSIGENFYDNEDVELWKIISYSVNDLVASMMSLSDIELAFSLNRVTDVLVRYRKLGLPIFIYGQKCIELANCELKNRLVNLEFKASLSIFYRREFDVIHSVDKGALILFLSLDGNECLADRCRLWIKQGFDCIAISPEGSPLSNACLHSIYPKIGVDIFERSTPLSLMLILIDALIIDLSLKIHHSMSAGMQVRCV